VQAIGSDSAAAVSWSAAADLVSPILYYTAIASPGGLFCTTTTALSCTISGLTNRQAYSITVTATNGNGTGPASSPPVVVTPLAGATYVALTPNRLVDSRPTGPQTGLSANLSNNSPVSFVVTDRNPGNSALNIPANAVAVTGNLTVTDQTHLGYLSLTPSKPSGVPSTSTLNLPTGDNRANAVTVPLGSNGTEGILWLTYEGAPGATTDVVFDVTGYFIPDTSGATYHALGSKRVLDTRSGIGGLSGPFTNHTARTFQVTGGSSGVPSNAIAVTGNLTVTGQTGSGYLFIGPVATNNPTSSTLNFPLGDDRANAVTVQLGAGGTLSITFVAPSNGPSAQAIFDVTGYFAPAGG
jgi:hypothetical protein